MTNSVVIMMIVIVKMVASSPTDYAGSFEHVSSANVVNKLTPKHFETADKITAASETLRSQTSSQAVQFKTAKNQFIDSSKDALAASHTAVHGVSVSEDVNDVNTLRPVRTIPTGSVDKATKSATTSNEHYSKAVAATYHESLLEVASTAQSGAGVMGAAASCEVCVYVVENKQMHQPFLCRGLKDPAYQQSCVTTLISMMWWLENQVYWVNYGCQRQAGGQWEWVKPCPAHVVCSWIQNLYSREPFCPKDEKYRKPS